MPTQNDMIAMPEQTFNDLLYMVRVLTEMNREYILKYGMVDGHIEKINYLCLVAEQIQNYFKKNDQ